MRPVSGTSTSIASARTRALAAERAAGPAAPTNEGSDMLAAIYEASDVGLRVDEVPDPVAGAGQVLVRVRAAGLNRADLLVRSGARRGHVSGRVEDAIAGGELAGEVVAKGDDAHGWELGDRLMGRGKGYAQFA